tara:strand:- start:35 stop:193 length:159 start_codon:yes stop_codon:yes gene_type:complete
VKGVTKESLVLWEKKVQQVHKVHKEKKVKLESLVLLEKKALAVHKDLQETKD